MHHSKSILILLLVSTISIKVSAEKAFMKYGKISEEEQNMQFCPFDSNASAVVLGDIGTSKFVVTQTDVKLNFERHVRIKIFNKESFDKGNFSIYLYKSKSGNEEKVTALKGAVYNMINEELIKTKLQNSSIFKDEMDKNHDVVKVTFPDIKEGSIIDFSYSVESPFLFNLETWYFQDDIPTLKSIYSVANIEWYNYKNWIEGYQIVKKEEETVQEKFSYMKSAEITTYGREKSKLIEFEADVTHMVYKAENIPAFKDEPYITTKNDYLSSVHFELQSTRYPWAIYKNYTNTWASINKMLNEDDDFGRTLKSDGHLKEASNKINLTTDSPNEKAILAYKHIKSKIAWDNRYSTQSNYSIGRVYEDGGGNSASINLNLVALCRRVGLEAYPVIISTRNNGKVRPGLISITQFNHTIAAININGEYLLMDAINPSCPYNLLPPQSLNGQGRLINETDGEWIDLYCSKYKKEIYMTNLSFNNKNTLSGELMYKATDYAALGFRDKYKSEESKEDFIIEFEKTLGGLEINEFNIKNLDSIHKPIVVKSQINISDGVNAVGDMIFLNPKVLQRNIENIFKAQERTYPVDYNYPLKQQFIIKIDFPEDYVIDEVPEQLVVALPDKKGKYVYSVKAIGNSIQLNNQFQINQTIFSGGDYPELKKFYELIVSKEAEQIVAKKAN